MQTTMPFASQVYADGIIRVPQRLYLKETENILVYKEDDQLFIDGSISTLAVDPKVSKEFLVLHFTDEANLDQTIVIDKSDGLIIQLALAALSGQHRAVFALEKTHVGQTDSAATGYKVVALTVRATPVKENCQDQLAPPPHP